MKTNCSKQAPFRHFFLNKQYIQEYTEEQGLVLAPENILAEEIQGKITCKLTNKRHIRILMIILN